MWDLFQTRWNLFFCHKSTRNHLFNERSELNKWIRVDLWQNYRFHRVEKISHWRLNTMHDATFSHICYILRCSSGVPPARCRRGGSRGAEPPLLRKLFIFYIKRKSKPSHVKIGLGLCFYWKNSRFHCFHAPQKCPTPTEFDDLSTVSTLNLPQILSRKWKSWWKTIHFLKANHSRKLK